MLQNLHVKNLALIDESEVDFAGGLNILSGETGAGKSIIIGSINLALGGKVQKEMLRNPEKPALVELIFSVTEKQKQVLKQLDVETEKRGRTTERCRNESQNRKLYFMLTCCVRTLTQTEKRTERNR